MWLFLLPGLSVLAAAVRIYASRMSKAVGPSSAHAAAQDPDAPTSQTLATLKWKYLAVYLTMRYADWLQGPYFYEAYASKIDSRTGQPFTSGTISNMFLVGFCSAMLFGAIAGSLADTFGRRLGCLICAAVFMTETLMVQSDTYEVLLLGRVLAGLASSMLHTVFESWLNSEAKRLKAPDAWLSEVFGVQWFGDGIVAVLAGISAEVLYGAWGGPIAVFNFSAVCLGVSFVAISALWQENAMRQGASSANTSSGGGVSSALPSSTLLSSLREAVNVARSDTRVLLLAGIQAMFEGAMYSFVLVWVPTIKLSAAAAAATALAASAADVAGEAPPPPATPALPFGIIFACYMVCIMIGSGLFSMLLSAKATLPVYDALVMVFLLAAAALGAAGTFVTSPATVAGGFLLFEALCGVYFPSMSSIRSQIIPPNIGSTLLSLFRLPLNVFVIAVLMNLEHLGEAQVLSLCAAALLFGAFLQTRLCRTLAPKPKA